MSTVYLVLSILQLQKKYREQQMPYSFAFIDTTKAFDLVSKHDLPQRSLANLNYRAWSILPHRHDRNSADPVQFLADPFDIRSSVKQGRVLAPTRSGLLFGPLLETAYDTTTEGIYLRARSDDLLFNLARLRAKAKVRDDHVHRVSRWRRSCYTHTQQELPSLMELFSVRTSRWLSVWRRQTWWHMIQKHCQSPPSTTTNSMLYVSSHTSDPPSRITSQWTDISTR